MKIDAQLKYSKSHEWVCLEGDTATIGLTDFAQNSLGDLVFVNLPDIGTEVTEKEPFTDIESVKAVSDVYAPVNGTVCAVNDALLDAPETINSDPYGAWLIKVEGVSGGEDLMDAAAYEAFCESEAE